MPRAHLHHLIFVRTDNKAQHNSNYTGQPTHMDFVPKTFQQSVIVHPHTCWPFCVPRMQVFLWLLSGYQEIDFTSWNIPLISLSLTPLVLAIKLKLNQLLKDIKVSPRIIILSFSSSFGQVKLINPENCWLKKMEARRIAAAHWEPTHSSKSFNFTETS